VLTESSWRWTFFVNVPIGILVALLAPRFLGESPRQHGAFDVPGALTGTIGLGSLVYGLTHAAPPHHWGDVLTVVPIVVGLAFLAAFVVIERRVEHPLLPFRILADRTRGVSFAVMLIVGAAMFSMFYFLGLFLQQVLGYSPVKAGFAFLPFSFGVVFAAQVASRLISRVDPRWIAGAGTLLASGGMWGFSHLTVHSAYTTGLLPFILMLSVGMGLTFVPMTLTAVAGVAKKDSGVGSAVLNTMQQVGGTLGLATLATVAATNGTQRAVELAAAVKTRGGTGQPSPEAVAQARHQIALAAQTYGSTRAFVVAACMILGGAVITVIGLDIKHQRLAADGAKTPTDGGVPVHVG